MKARKVLKLMRKESREVTDDTEAQERIYQDKRKRFMDKQTPKDDPQSPKVDTPKQNPRPLDSMYPATQPKNYALQVAIKAALR